MSMYFSLCSFKWPKLVNSHAGSTDDRKSLEEQKIQNEKNMFASLWPASGSGLVQAMLCLRNSLDPQ